MNDQQVVHGGIYYVDDSKITLPPDSDRSYHESRRPVVVLSGPETNGKRSWQTVLAAPVSSSTSRKTSYCVRLAAGEGGMSKKCWVRVVAVQPLLKSDLGDRTDVLRPVRLEEIQARLFQYLGVLDDPEEPLFAVSPSAA